MANPGEIFGQIGKVEEMLTESIREHLVRAHELRDDESMALDVTHHLARARKDMERLLNLNKVMYP